MLVKFNAKDFKISDKTLDGIESKIHRRFDKYFSGKDEDVIFYVRLTDQKKLKEKVELTLPYCGYQLRAEVSDKEGIMAALDKGMDIVERQIAKCKTKLARNKHQTPEPPVSPVYDDEPEEYAVVRTKKHELKPMTVQEAILNMDMLGHQFYMFMNSESNKICTVYVRNDGDYGLIEPLL